MRISRVQITNFRNFKSLDVALSEHAVIVGENKIGKSNFIYALRLLLDPMHGDGIVPQRLLRKTFGIAGLLRPLRPRIPIRMQRYAGNTPQRATPFEIRRPVSFP